MIKLIIVEDNEIIREGLSALINGTAGYNCVSSYGNCENMLQELPKLSADLVLMDIGLPGMSGIEGVRRIKKMRPEIEILMLTVYEDSEKIFAALCAGACGYLVKKTPPARLLESIKEAYEGGSPINAQLARHVVRFFYEQEQEKQLNASGLTAREKEILHGLMDGNTYQAIGFDLKISIDTVRYHIRNIYRKLQVHSESEAVAKALMKKMI
jgi:DNA-binding NarL/FixJ family response regulator